MPTVKLGYNWVQDLDPDVRSILLKSASERIVGRREIIYEGAQAIPSVLQVKTGNVRQFIMDENGNEILLHVYHEGDVLGDSLGLDGEPYGLWLSAANDVILREWALEKFNHLRACHRSIDSAIAAQTTRRLRHTLSILEDLAMLDSPGRVASRLHWLAEMVEVDGSATLECSQAEIATMANVSRQTVNKALADLKSQGAITLRYGNILVQDTASLKRYRDQHRRRI
jgi:CRP/FNR family transcriptional regulator, cyclic AMP receptor protein